MYICAIRNGANLQILCRKFFTNIYQQSKSNSINKQVKIIGKLYGERNSGSKKRWYPTENAHTSTNTNSLFSKTIKVGSSNGGKNNTRRMQVLNKLFMEHISSLLATGEASEHILGRGLQVTRVKISQDFALVNVYWMGSGDVQKDAELEKELQRCSGILRHELSQLELMGVVPRIKFVRDKRDVNLMQVDAILQNLDLSSNEEASHNFKCDFFGENTEVSSTNTIMQDMRHDVFGLDHKGIMLRIVGKMSKSKQAWDMHNHKINAIIQEMPKEEILEDQTKQLKEFLTKKRVQKNVLERNKSLQRELWLQSDYGEEDHSVLSHAQKQLYEEEDYLHDEEVDKTKN